MAGISQALINAMARPAWSDDLGRGVQGMFANIGKAKMLKPLMESQVAFQDAQQGGHVGEAGAVADKLLKQSMKTGNTEGYNRAMEMRKQLPAMQQQAELRKYGQIKQVLQRQDLPPEARANLEGQVKQLERNPVVQKALKAQADAKYQNLIRGDKVGQIQRADAERKALGMLMGGASQEDVTSAVGPEAMAGVLPKYQNYVSAQQELNSQVGKPFDYTSEYFTSLEPEQQKIVKSSIEMGGPDKGREVLMSQYKLKQTGEMESRLQEQSKYPDSEAEFVGSLFDSSPKIKKRDWLWDTTEEATEFRQFVDSQDKGKQKIIRDNVKQLYRTVRTRLQEESNLTGDEFLKEVNAQTKRLIQQTYNLDAGGPEAEQAAQSPASGLDQVRAELEALKEQRAALMAGDA